MALRWQRDLAKEHAWRQRVTAQASSGLTIRAFCRRRGLAEAAFYFWRREIARRDGLTQRSAVPRRPTAGEVSLPASARGRAASRQGSRSPAGPAFVPVRVLAERPSGANASNSSGLEVALPGGAVLRVSRDFDAATLKRLLAVWTVAPPGGVSC